MNNYKKIAPGHLYTIASAARLLGEKDHQRVWKAVRYGKVNGPTVLHAGRLYFGRDDIERLRKEMAKLPRRERKEPEDE